MERWVVLALASPALVSGADFSSVVEERQELMKANREAQKALKSAADAGDLATTQPEDTPLPPVRSTAKHVYNPGRRSYPC